MPESGLQAMHARRVADATAVPGDRAAAGVYLEDGQSFDVLVITSIEELPPEQQGGAVAA